MNVVVIVMSGITAKAEKTALIGSVWSIVGRDMTDLPGIRIAIAGIVAGTVSLVGYTGVIGSACTQEQAGGWNKEEIDSFHREV